VCFQNGFIIKTLLRFGHSQTLRRTRISRKSGAGAFFGSPPDSLSLSLDLISCLARNFALLSLQLAEKNAAKISRCGISRKKATRECVRPTKRANSELRASAGKTQNLAASAAGVFDKAMIYLCTWPEIIPHSKARINKLISK
jgi:hypothetical protein